MRYFILPAFLLLFLPGASAQQIKFYRTYGEGVYNSGQAVLQTADSGYVVCGGINEMDDNGLNVMLFRTDSLGVQQWRKSIGGPGIDFAKHFTYAHSGAGWVTAGYTNRNGNYDALIVATDLNGDTVWTRVYGGNDWDMAYSIDTTFDGGYIVAGETFSFGAGNSDMWILKLAANGDTLWTRTYGGVGEDNARWVFEDRDSNLVVVGSTQSYGAGLSDVYIAYLDASGDSLWTTTSGTAGNEYGYSGDMYFDLSNNLSMMIGGNMEVAAQNFTTFYLMRVSTAGNVLYVLQGDQVTPIARDHVRLRNEGNSGKFYYSVDYQPSFSPFPRPEFHRTYYGGGYGYVDYAVGSVNYAQYTHDVLKTYDLGYVITGESEFMGPNIMSSLLIKMDSVGNTVANPVLGEEEPEIFSGVLISPNPAHAFVQVSGIPLSSGGTYSLFDLAGREYAGGNWQPGTAAQWIDMGGLAPGMYAIRLQVDGYTITRRIIHY